ncbi:MAG TPA: TetR/AcrR family transcriptional regulator [Chloroflexia bacterium]|nr:TetR/AcrR family transcriptional regulator [Chloroflexia bacterium]
MGSKERRERQKQELREGILAAALRIASAEGWQAVTMRKVAELIEYSPPTIYEYFESKDAILGTLAQEGFRKLRERLETAGAGGAGAPMVRLALAYCAFAWEHPQLYQVMFGMGGAICRLDSALPDLDALSRIMMTAARTALPAVAEPDRAAVLEIHFATLHGIVSLAMQDLLGSQERADRLAEQATHDWLRAHQARSEI